MTALPFRSGVIEGFYGRPWSEAQRLRLVADLAAWGLNTYLYAPKDDLKHRTLWRAPYDRDELASLGLLAEAAAAAGVDLAYGLAPGLDLRFADGEDAAALHDKLAQILGRGVRTVALLFDDVPRELHPQDAERYGTLAAAQAETANRLRAQVATAGGALLFCPTDYCAAMARPSVAESGYLRELGERLAPDIEVFWAGPDVVSETIEVDDVRAAAEALGRKPLLWDNLHANDYDLRRLHLGPYSGRPAALKAEVRGVLLNPNNQPGADSVPLMTLAAYLRDDAYQPRVAFLEATAAWAGRLELVGDVAPDDPDRSDAGIADTAGSVTAGSDTSGSDAADSDTTETSTERARTVSADDLAFLADFLYLPFEQGPAAEAFLEDVAYLLSTPPAAWGDILGRLAGAASRLARLARTLTRLRDRELLASLHPYVTDVLIEAGTAAQRVAARRSGRALEKPRDGIGNVPRGGFAGALSRLLEASAPKGAHDP